MFKTIDEILASSLIGRMNAITDVSVTDRVLKSTRLEQKIYNDLHSESENLPFLEPQGTEKIKSFKSLINDTFQSFYSISPRFTDEEKLTAIARKLNKYILSDIMHSEDYAPIKSICEGREIPAIEATEEFIETLLPRLDELLEAASGQKESLNTLEKTENQRDELLDLLADLLEKRQNNQDNPELNKKILQTANKAESKVGQADMLGKMVDRNLQKNKDTVSQIIKNSVQSAKKQTTSVQNALMAWGDGDASFGKTVVNTEILKKVKASDRLMYVTKFLGRYKEMFSNMRKNSFAFGRGEKYDIEYGNKIDRALTSELSLLAIPETVPLLLRKHQNKQIKQYRKREAVYKGGGDIIVCLDESTSTFGEAEAWGKALALTMLEVCRKNKRNFALVHFSSTVKTHLFLANENVDIDKMVETAETLLGGGTDFTLPIYEAVNIIEQNLFNQPDVVFITDGICDITEDFKAWLKEKQKSLKFTITGILLDSGMNFDFTLQEFADTVYRTSELCMDDIMGKMIKNKI